MTEVKGIKTTGMMVPDQADMASRTNTQQTLYVIISVALVVMAGIGTGYLLARKTGATSSRTLSSVTGENSEASGNTSTVAGVEDIEGKDDVTGKLVKGGMDGEGSHHLERDGGPSQNVYLVSSVIDLDAYVEQEVHVWGDTFTAQKAGWFMDVIRLEVVK